MLTTDIELGFGQSTNIELDFGDDLFYVDIELGFGRKMDLGLSQMQAGIEGVQAHRPAPKPNKLCLQGDFPFEDRCHSTHEEHELQKFPRTGNPDGKIKVCPLTPRLGTQKLSCKMANPTNRFLIAVLGFFVTLLYFNISPTIEMVFKLPNHATNTPPTVNQMDMLSFVSDDSNVLHPPFRIVQVGKYRSYDSLRLVDASFSEQSNMMLSLLRESTALWGECSNLIYSTQAKLEDKLLRLLELCFPTAFGEDSCTTIRSLTDVHMLQDVGKCFPWTESDEKI